MMPAQSSQPMMSLQSLLADWVTLARDVEISSVTLDSRSVTDGSLFLAVSGQNRHGLEYVEQALQSGAVAVVYDPAGEGAMLAERHQLDSAAIWVPLAQLAQRASVIADRIYGHPSSDLAVIGITGTNGKTSCSHFLGQTLDWPKSAGVIGTLGWGRYGALELTQNTTPDPVSVQAQLAALRDQSVASVAMEVSSHGLEQGRVSGVRFQGAMFTNLTRDHLDYHGTMDAYAASKQQLFQAPGLAFAVFNVADPAWRQMFQGLNQDVRAFGFASKSVANLPAGLEILLARDIHTDQNGLQFEVEWAGQRQMVRTGLLGRFNVDNVLAVMAVLLAKGVLLADAAERISHLKSIPGRMESFGSVGRSPLVIVDYAHTPDALENVLSSLKPHCQGQLITVFGCGGDRDAGKRPQMGRVAERLSNRVVVTDDNPRNESPEQIVRDILAGCDQPERIQVLHDRRAAIATALSQATVDDVVLVAGKGHETTQQIGNQRMQFSDRQCVRELLLRWSADQHGGSGWTQ